MQFCFSYCCDYVPHIFFWVFLFFYKKDVSFFVQQYQVAPVLMCSVYCYLCAFKLSWIFICISYMKRISYNMT